MSKSTVPKKSDDGSEIPATMKTRHFFGDAMTALSMNIIINLAGLLTYFYTDIIGMAAGMAGMVILVTKIADAFTDIGMGALVDGTRSKYGKARPWLLRMIMPALIGVVLLFTIPASAGMGVKVTYALATNIFMLAIVYTAIAVPSGSLLSLETKNPHERAKMGIWRLVFAYIAGTTVTALLVPATNRLGGGQRAWIIMGAVLGIISAVSLAVAFFSIKENNNVPLQAEEEKTPLLHKVALLFKNKYWVIALAVNVLIQVVYALGSAEVYYAKYIFGDENLVASIGFFRLLFVFFGFVLTGLLIRRLGKRTVVLVGMAVSIASCVLRAIAPYYFTVNLVAMGLSALGGVPLLAVIGAMIADTIEYGEWKTGKRMVGLTSSANSFGSKLAAGIWAGAIGLLLTASGYNGMLVKQPPMAEQMIVFVNIYVPLICYIAIFVLMLFYTLDRDYGRIMTELEARRSQEEKILTKR